MKEPSVLDYLVAKLMPWRGPAPELPPPPKAGKKARVTPKTAQKTARAKAATGTPAKQPASKKKAAAGATETTVGWPWRSAGAFGLFLAGQFVVGRVGASPWAGLPFALGALALFTLAARTGEWRLPEAAEAQEETNDLLVRQIPLALGMAFFILTLVFSGENRFTFLNVSSWLAAIGFTLAAFWQRGEGDEAGLLEKLRARLGDGEIKLSVSRWTLLLVGAFVLAAFFRFFQLGSVPPEMQSDHAEKLFDVFDVLNGQYSIFFPRNTGREPLQFYLTAAVANVFGTGISFLSLKIGTALLGLLSLIYMYLLGKELGGRWAGLLTMLLTGIAYWPNVLARAGLRFMLYPAFAAPVLYYLVRGFRRARVNEFLLAGLFLGIGLHGYTPFRVVPLVAIAALVIYWLHKPDPEARRRVLIGFALMVLISLVVFAPLLRYAVDNPDSFGFRMLSRVTGTQTEIPGNPMVIFFQNLFRALGMANLSGGDIWLVGVPHRPALDLISAALFLLGIALVVLRYLRRRGWQDLFLLIAVPMLMLPSIMSLAFPQENPAMNRAGGALVAIFIISGLGLDALLHSLKERLPEKNSLSIVASLGAVLVLGASLLNYDLVFNRYNAGYTQSSWNTSEMGEVIASFAEGVGSYDQAWVVAFPHWVDTRLVAINAGYPGHDYGIWPENFATTLETPAPKLFLLWHEDVDGLNALQAMYPQGTATRHASEQPNKDFMVFFVAPAAGD